MQNVFHGNGVWNKITIPLRRFLNLLISYWGASMFLCRPKLWLCWSHCAHGVVIGFHVSIAAALDSRVSFCTHIVGNDISVSGLNRRVCLEDLQYDQIFVGFQNATLYYLFFNIHSSFLAFPNSGLFMSLNNNLRRKYIKFIQYVLKDTGQHCLAKKATVWI